MRFIFNTARNCRRFASVTNGSKNGSSNYSNSFDKLRTEKNKQFAADIESLCKKSMTYDVFRRDLNSLKLQAKEIEDKILESDKENIYT